MLSAVDVAARLSLSRATVYRLAEGRVIPGAVRIGESWRFDADQIDEWLAESPEGRT
jgi:excisionase family DNA binding protein